MKKIAVLGSTGSIGTQTLEVAEAQEDMEIAGLSAGSNIQLLEEQIRRIRPRLAVVYDKKKAKELAENIKDLPTVVEAGMEGLIQLAQMEEADVLVTAIVGMIGIEPTIAAIQAGKDIALANKETLVTAGHIIMALAEEKGVSILPVDSEHSAIFQVLQGQDKRAVSKIWLTASGGPFRGKDKEFLKTVKREDALKHPNWSMGQKITVDSATMVNKGLEVMEARWLFQVPLNRIQVVVHPQSIVHSMVEYTDGALIAQLGAPDMKLPIQYALTYPDRRSMDGEKLSVARLSRLTFEDPDLETFRGLGLAYKAGEMGGSMPTVYNAANELAVRKFLQNKISFLEIYELLEMAMGEHKRIENPTVAQILQTEAETYETIESRW